MTTIHRHTTVFVAGPQTGVALPGTLRPLSRRLAHGVWKYLAQAKNVEIASRLAVSR